ncbi:hypothetical protein [Amycolatopsis silviterrae]|uniref:Uncharacterized protein n=1 Tax=Amycolatopsis silviterrae TaxID=1656914 RepID=A0ABW5HEV1_9PSEU
MRDRGGRAGGVADLVDSTDSLVAAVDDGGGAVEDRAAANRVVTFREPEDGRAAEKRSAPTIQHSTVDRGAADVVQETPPKRDTSTRGDEAAKRKPRGRWWRGFTGSVAAGMAVLAVGVLVVGVLCVVNGASGPGVLKLVGHPVAAVIVLALQRVADRRVGKTAACAGVVVLVVAAAALGVLWWA